MQFLKKCVPYVIAFTLGLACMAGFDAAYTRPDSAQIARQIREGGGTYTNPLLECDVAIGSINAPKARFERELEKEVAMVESRDSVSEVAVYYRDLNNGPAFGIKENEEFFPASLLKVPILMSFLKHSENDRDFLLKKVDFNKDSIPDLATPVISPEVALENKHEYSVSALLEHMIMYSDNYAMEALYPLLPEKEYTELYERLGIHGFDIGDSRTTLTVVEYATFFRVLFNASYLSQDSSEKALELLTRSMFKDGIRAGVPSTIEVAHKFGERDLGDGYYQLHDCGIVYIPKNPYLVCIMTRGTKQEDLKTAIKDISKFTYDQVTK